MATTFKTGDVVRLKSGGPTRTVGTLTSQASEGAECFYFRERELVITKYISFQTLQLVPNDELTKE